MPRTKLSPVAKGPHWLRLVQLVAPGTPDAFVDPIFGCSWLATPKAGPKQGLNGKGGFLQVQDTPVLNDATEMVVSLPPKGSDGRPNRDRLYFYSDTPDPANPGQTIGYMPVDEWIECYRGNSELVATGTPVSESGQQAQIDVTCRDVVEILKKTQETQAGFWCHAPRDVFEYYTRAWKSTISDDFTNPSLWPVTSGSGTTSDGRWEYANASQSPLGASYVRLTHTTVGGDGRLIGQEPLIDAGGPGHSSWRLECEIANVNGSNPTIILQLAPLSGAGTQFAQLTIAPTTGDVVVQTGGSQTWTVNVAGLLDTNGNIDAPLTLAIERRERWCYFYLNGQLIAVGAQPRFATSTTLYPSLVVHRTLTGAPIEMDVDYMVFRQTTVPLNGGDPGDYVLPSAPDPGGVFGEYYDLTNYDYSLPDPTVAPTATRNDSGVLFVNSPTPGWMPSAMQQSTKRYLRDSGSIYLPLASQDVHFTIEPCTAGASAALRVGKTRDGEAVCAAGSFPGETNTSTSVGMRSLFGNVSGWYPLIFEYIWTAADTANDTVGFTYDVGGAGTVPAPDVLSPDGLVDQQVTGSHYTELQTLTEQFAINWRSTPMKLESGSFPGAIVPRARIGRDTDKVLTEAENLDPSTAYSAEDNATTTVGQGPGLAGSSSGQLTAEAFNFPVMGSHPTVLTETENLPAVTSNSLLATQLESLLALRSETWEQVQTTVPAQRSMQGPFPPVAWLPLPADLEEFDWQPGDGLLRDLPSVGIDDTEPVPILQVQRLRLPDGSGGVQVSFAQRPRNFHRTMVKFIRGVYAERKQFQGQLAYDNGSTASGAGPSQVPLPLNSSLVRQAELIIMAKSDASTWTVSVNGTATGQAVTGVGILDVSSWIDRNGGTDLQMIAALTGSTGTITYRLRLLVLIPKA